MKPITGQRQRGVSLLEVLISIVVIAIGILGLAKMQALSISNTQISSSRNLVALQASSMAALMHANPAFWQISSPAAPPCNGAGACTLTGATTLPASFPAAPTSCSAYPSTCSSGQLASLDLKTWMGVMNTQVPTYTLIINCTLLNGTGPTTCVVEITWLEKQQGMNKTTAAFADATPSQQQSYFLYVQP